MSDFHLMTLTVTRKGSKKYHLKTIGYSSYKNFSYEKYRECQLIICPKKILLKTMMVFRDSVTQVYNLGHNILRLLDVLLNFPFTTSETIYDY